MKKNLRVISYLLVLATVSAPFGFGQGTVDRATEKSKSGSSDTGFISSAWDSIAFWKKEKVTARMHHLAGSPPTSLESGDSFEQWDETAKFAAKLKKNLPTKPHEIVSGGPSYSSFLDILKEIEAAKSDLDESETEDLESVDPKPNDTEELGSPSEPNGFESDNSGSGEIDHSSDVTQYETEDYSKIEAVFPRPYERFISGERLLMFFPVGDLPSNNSGGSQILLPLDNSILFQPPTVNPTRSSVTMRNEN